MKYMIAIETTQYVEVEAETADAAIETVKQKINYKPTDATAFYEIKELTFDEKSGSYKVL